MSRPVAFRRGGTLDWVGADHLGGTIRVLDGSFTALDGMRYKPYGEDRDTGSSLNTDRKFTGQTEDETAGLYWYASRAYDPEIGRFVSPDPIVPAPGYPPALNRYAHVYNNPLKYVDPSGHSAEWVNEDWREEFIRKHKREPTGLDIAYRYESMQAASQGQDFSVEYWAGEIERTASNIAGAVERALPSVSIDIVDIGGQDDETNKQLIGLGRALDWADLTITGGMALGTVLATATTGLPGLATFEAAYQPISFGTSVIDGFGVYAVGRADIRAGRTRVIIGSNSAEFSIGRDTVMSISSFGAGLRHREVLTATLVDIAQIAYTESRAAGLPARSYQIKIEFGG